MFTFNFVELHVNLLSRAYLIRGLVRSRKRDRLRRHRQHSDLERQVGARDTEAHDWSKTSQQGDDRVGAGDYEVTQSKCCRKIYHGKE